MEVAHKREVGQLRATSMVPVTDVVRLHESRRPAARESAAAVAMAKRAHEPLWDVAIGAPDAQRVAIGVGQHELQAGIT